MYLGNFEFGTTVHRMFTTVGSSGAPAALSSAAVTVYRDGSSVEDNTGVTLVASYDRTGQNKVVIDMSTAGFYSSAGEYMAIISSGGTASADMAGYVVAQWSLRRGPTPGSTLSLISTSQALASVASVTGNVVGSVGSVASATGIATAVWGATRSSYTGSGSFGQIVSTSTAAPNIYVSNSSLVTSQFSTAGLETASSLVTAVNFSTVGLETASSVVDLSALAIDLVSSGVWDEVLSGASHNVTNSAGRRLRALQDFAGYEGGAVWIDTVNGTSNIDDFEGGTVNNRVDSVANAKTIADSIGLKHFHITAGSCDVLAATYTDYEFIGENYLLDLGGQEVDNTIIQGGRITGSFTGTPTFMDCEMRAFTGPSAWLMRCALTSTAMESSSPTGGNWYLDSCYSGVAGTATPAFDFGVGSSSINLNVRHYSGGLEILNMGSTGTDTMSMEGHGQLVIASGNVAGNVAIRGHFTVTDNAGGALTLSDDARYDSTQIRDAVWNSTRSLYTASGSFGEIVSTSTAAPSIWANSAAGSPSSDIAAQVWNTTRSNFTAAGSFGELVSTSTADPLQAVRATVAGTTNVNVVEWGGSTVTGMPYDSSLVTSQFSTAGLETMSSDVIAPAVWNATRASYTAAGSFGQIVSTSTAAPLQSVYTSTLVTSQFSTVGLETVSTVGLETLSTAGLETLSSDVLAPSIWNATRASYTAAGSFGEIVSTSTAAPLQSVYTSTLVTSQFSTAGLETLSTVGIETLSTVGLETLSTLGIETLSTVGIETLSSAGLETASSVVTVAGSVSLSSDGLDSVIITEQSGAPSSAPTLPAAMAWQHMTLRGQIRVNSSNKIFYGQGGQTIWAKGLLGDSATYIELLGTTST